MVILASQSPGSGGTLACDLQNLRGFRNLLVLRLPPQLCWHCLAPLGQWRKTMWLAHRNGHLWRHLSGTDSGVLGLQELLSWPNPLGLHFSLDFHATLEDQVSASVQGLGRNFWEAPQGCRIHPGPPPHRSTCLTHGVPHPALSQALGSSRTIRHLTANTAQDG